MNYGTPTMSLFDLTPSSVRSSFTTSNYLDSSPTTFAGVHSTPDSRSVSSRRTIRWILETSIAVPVAFLLLGLGILIYKHVLKFRKIFRPSNSVMELGQINFGPNGENIDEEIVVYSHSRNLAETSL